jgi:uncharacterized MAPEG superfamily protein
VDFWQIPVKPLLLLAIAAGAAMVYVPYIVVAYARAVNNYDMSAPRAMFDRLPDWGKRATWAHQNGWESFVLFTAAALMAYVSGANSDALRWAAIAYVAARFFFAVFYIFDLPPLRSLMFGVGTVSIFTLMSESIKTALSMAN